MIPALLLLALCTLDLKLPAGRPRNERRVDTIVLHHTAVPTTGDSIRTLRRRGMSYHYLIDEDGEIIFVVPFGQTAFHAAGANRTSIGIAFVGGASPAWKPSKKQHTAAKGLIVRLVRQHAGLRYLVGHGDIRDTNAGEPYGVAFDKLINELEAESNLALQHPSKDDTPLADFRRAALELFVSPRSPRTPSRSQRWPEDESVTCAGKRVRYKVSAP